MKDDVAPDLSWFEVISQSKSMFLSEDDIQRITMGRLRPALFLGETNNGLFAIPMIVDNASHSMPKLLGPRLIDGPIPTSMEINIEALERRPHLPRNLPLTMTTYKTVEGEYLLLGLHKYPRFLTRTKLQFTDPTHIPYLMSYPYLEYQDGQGNKFTKTCFKKGCGKNNLNEISGTPSWPRIEQQLSDDDRSLSDLLGEIWKNHPLFVMMLGMFSITLIFVTVYMCGRASVYPTNQVPSRETSHASQRSRAHSSDQSKKTWSQLIFRNGSKSSSSNPYFEEPDDDLPPGWRQIGKLQYDTNAVLGRGCEGTIVYKGKFDGREAAIKRVVIENFSFADREINILRESDTNPNVIRYFCSEADHSFRFIALELCECTLKDYVLNPGIQANYADFPKVDLLCQATKGLDYLHRNKIVHRDVKPQNILLSRDAGNRVRVLISDFGLCKKIPAGRASISRFSGLAGTEGWIAPEVYIDGASVTCMADVFSLGCLYFFVLTNGKHPFGDALRRQDNILKGEYNLGALTQPDTSFNIAAMNLIETMIQPKTKTRPTLKVVLTHPMFWSNERQLQFFMDVSDRIEKEDENNDVVQRLERYGARVTRNWHAEICNPLREDLRKFRSYRTHSIRDLLRALRNKKHHYRELPPDVKQSLGDIPNGYVYYWTSRFPRLLMHIYNAMICCAEESAFASYYPIEAHSFCNRRLEEELDSDFIVAGPTIPLKHTTSTPVLPGSPARQQRDATPENWRNGDKGPISANAAKKRKKKKRAQISVLSPTEESDDNLGPEGDAKEN
uniref:Endoribonuclease n=1 Tax=Panagrolaimus sp. JU765 TaxID=591449 RepID=A0AC34QNQ1_9BILA